MHSFHSINFHSINSCILQSTFGTHAVTEISIRGLCTAASVQPPPYDNDAAQVQPANFVYVVEPPRVHSCQYNKETVTGCRQKAGERATSQSRAADRESVQTFRKRDRENLRAFLTGQQICESFLRP